MVFRALIGARSCRKLDAPGEARSRVKGESHRVTRDEPTLRNCAVGVLGEQYAPLKRRCGQESLAAPSSALCKMRICAQSNHTAAETATLVGLKTG
jgi:hypothetical protein